MEISIGSKVVFKKDGNEYFGIVSYCYSDGYVISYIENDRFESIELQLSDLTHSPAES